MPCFRGLGRHRQRSNPMPRPRLCSMRIHIATDHAGLDFSTQLQQHLAAAGHDVFDHGPVSYDPVDDYPAFCIKAAEAVMADAATGVTSLGVVFGGSGNGEQIAANKVAGIRAALVWSLATAELAREHNDANVIAPASTRSKKPSRSSTCSSPRPSRVKSATPAASLSSPSTSRRTPSRGLSSTVVRRSPQTTIRSTPKRANRARGSLGPPHRQAVRPQLCGSPGIGIQPSGTIRRGRIDP